MTHIVVFTLLTLIAMSVGEIFQDVDLDKNGLIDKSEFYSYVGKIHNAIDPYLGVNAQPVIQGDMFQSFMKTGANFVSGFINSLVVILITEIGDKTFFIAAVLAMRNARLVVYLGSMSALAAMHVLSSLLGFALPALLPRAYTHLASIILFIYFGIKLLKDAYEMKSDGPSEELHEVEEELIHEKTGEDTILPDHHLEENTGSTIHKHSPKKEFLPDFTQSENFKVFTQALTLTFLAEWGDRSQIATIALAASKNVLGVIIGGLIGHAFCTGLAVIGGRLLAARISERTVAILGGVLFLVFAIHSYVSGSDV